MKKVYLLIAALAVLAGCRHTDGWSLKGDAPEGVDTVIVQAPKFSGGWYNLDTAIVKDGKYDFKLTPANGTIYRVKLGERIVYVPADSTETLSLTSSGVRSGSDEAVLFNIVDSLAPDGNAILRALDGHYSSTAAYYATRILKDGRLLRTVTNRYNEERPTDARTVILKAELQKIMPKPTASGETQVIYAEEISYYDIELMNRNGEFMKLSDVVDNNPLVVLAYVDFTNGDTPAITRAIGDAHDAGAEIYEIGFADNQHIWANLSENLPWVNVYQSDAASRNHISQYAVGTFPTFFIFKNGEIIDRVSDYSILASTVAKYK